MKRRTSIKLIEKAASEKWMKELAFCHLLKFRFNNSCIYDYRSRMKEIAGIFNISEASIYRYIKVLRSKNLAYSSRDNLYLKSIKGSIKTTLILPDSYDLFDVTCLLYAKLIEKKGRHMAFVESVRRSRRGYRLNDKLRESPFRPSFSLRNISKLCNISIPTTKLVIENLKRLGVMSFEKQKARLLSDNFTELGSVQDLPGYRFNIGKKLFEIFGQRIDFLQFPVFLKKIPYQRLKVLKCIYVIIVVTFLTKY